MATPRRHLLKAMALAAAAPGAVAAAQAFPAGPDPIGKNPRVRRIATEEGFSIPELGAATAKYLATHDDEPGQAAMRHAHYSATPDKDWLDRLNSLGELRLKHMDEAGIDASVLLVSSAGVQVFGADEGTELARLVNDRAAEAAKKYPDRFYPLAAIAPQDPDRAAQEFERAVKTLGMKGAIINSHTKGQYLDEDRFTPILEVAQAMDVPIYIHPREPAPKMIAPFLSPAMLAGATWGFAAETGLHGVRLITSGVFDKFPKLKIVLGHLGEGIPFFMDRLDVRYRQETVTGRPVLKRKPSEYFLDNFIITTSGMNWAPAIRFCQQVMGPEKVLFAADYPFENAVDAVQTAEATPMPATEHAMFFHQNAERVFKL